LITEDLLQFAETLTTINEKDKEIIHYAHKSLPFNNKEPWIKKGGNLFDVTMGAYDGAKICELVGCFLLSNIASKYNKHIGL